MSSKKRTVYSKEFKLNAVRMVTEEGRRASEVARDLGISANMLYLWKRKVEEDGQEVFPGRGNLKATEEYIRQLERENARLKEERAILKKATQFFAKES